MTVCAIPLTDCYDSQCSHLPDRRGASYYGYSH